MAVAGINNVSVLETSYHGENYSSVSRRWGNQEKPITRTSFIRKMWHDLEGETRIRETERQQTSGIVANSNMGSQCSCSSEGAESEDVLINTSEAENECPRENQMEIKNVLDDNENTCVQRPPAISVADKERVRQVFREWGSKNSSRRVSEVPHKNNCARAQWLCENECKRVRTVREWMESNAQQAEIGHSVVEEQVTEICSQVERERERDEYMVDRTRVGSRRSVRGRQAFLDLLSRFEMQRGKEIKELLESRLVSNFAHRNRIQALLKGRFLWNQKFAEDEKSISTAASELGLLKQTHTVSDLRKGFLSRVDNQSDTSSDNGMKIHENQLRCDIVNEYDTINTRSNIKGTHCETKTCGSSRQYDAPAGEAHKRVLETKGKPPPPPPPPPPTAFVKSWEHNVKHVIQAHDHCQSNGDGTHTRVFETKGKPPPPPLLPPTERIKSREQKAKLKGLAPDHGQSNGDGPEVNETFDHLNSLGTNAVILSRQVSSVEFEESLTNYESIEGLHENSIKSQAHGQTQSDRYELEVNETFDHQSSSETNTEILSWQEGSVEAEGNLTKTESIESSDGASIESPANDHHQSDVDEQEVYETFDHQNPSEANTVILFWEEGSVEADDSLTNRESIECSDANSIKRQAYGQYHSDGDRVEANQTFAHQNLLETNNILSWQEGSVEAEERLINTESNEGLDANSIENEDGWYQEIMSDIQESHDEWYDNLPVVRTDAISTSDDDNGGRPELQELMSRRRVSNLLQSDFRVRLDQLLQANIERQYQAPESDDEWMLEREQQDPDQQTVDDNDDVTEAVERNGSAHPLPPTVPQHSGNEWEIINGLRIDMILLHERMNSMQITLETCMKMQLELQRSVKQEVSLALSRSSSSGDNLQTCFLCCDSDSSPNGRGHTYVCSHCAEKINWLKLKESVRHP